MPKHIYRENWLDNSILNRLVGRSDFDSDGTFQLRDYEPGEHEACASIKIEGSEDGGSTWQACEFSERIAYIDGVGAGWPWPFSSYGVFFESKRLTWRAVLPD